YDFHYDAKGMIDADAQPKGLTLIRKWFGKNVFANARVIAFRTASPNDVDPVQFSEALNGLARLTEIKSLSFENTPLDDDALKRLPPLSKLESLSLAGTRVTSAGLVSLRSRSELESLVLNGIAL